MIKNKTQSTKWNKAGTQNNNLNKLETKTWSTRQNDSDRADVGRSGREETQTQRAKVYFVLSHKKCILLLILFANFNIKPGEIILCISIFWTIVRWKFPPASSLCVTEQNFESLDSDSDQPSLRSDVTSLHCWEKWELLADLCVRAFCEWLRRNFSSWSPSWYCSRRSNMSTFPHFWSHNSERINHSLHVVSAKREFSVCRG